MAKQIVFCADGTWNGPEGQAGRSPVDGDDDAGELTVDLAGEQLTNVVKLYNRLAGVATAESKSHIKEQEKVLVHNGQVVQVAKYLHGVGDSSNSVMKVMGGAFGVGVIARIVRGYTFISRHYQPGDTIHILGFSRGAYTARALAGMIARVGLLDASRYNVDDKEEAYKRGRAAWRMSKGLTISGKTKAAGLLNKLIDWVEVSLAKFTLKEPDLIPNIPIKSVAVWDTVGSMGMPLYLKDKRYDLFRFTDTVLSDKVERGFHAMAVDELRMDFPVTPWEARNGIEQVWFVGAHADVGGGYKTSESYLSDVALEWMLKQLSSVGVQFSAPLTCAQLGECLKQPIHKPWDKPPFKVLDKSPRHPTATDIFHATVVERWKSDASYRPKALQFVGDGIDKLRLAP